MDDCSPDRESEFVNSTNRHAKVHGVFKDFGDIASVKLLCAVQLVHETVDGYRDAIDPPPAPTEGDSGLERPD